MGKGNPHIPVLLNESISGLSIRSDGVYIDATFGSGGHSRQILSLLGRKGRLIAFDQDKLAFEYAPEADNFILVHSNFAYVKNFIKYLDIEHVNGILADLGISSMHLDMPQRGFSYRFDAPLDMRMNREQKFSAYDVVNDYSQQALSDILFQFGELRNAHQLAADIIKARSQKKLNTTFDLVRAVEKHIPQKMKNKILSKIFQAIRIEVNDELENLKKFLEAGAQLLCQGGRFAVITFHSLEDRLVKNYFRYGNFDGMPQKDKFGNIISPLKPVNKKVITPSLNEQTQNSRARSAKLRIAEKL